MNIKSKLSTNAHEQCGTGFYQALGRPELDGVDASPITAEAIQRFFGAMRNKDHHHQGLIDHHADS